MQNSIISLKRTYGSVTEPVTLTEVKTHLHITDSENDTELTAMITRCRKRIEDYANISIVSQTVELIANLSKCIRLPYPPLVSIDSLSVMTAGVGGTSEALTVSDYSLIGTQDALFQSNRCAIHTVNYTTGMATVAENLKLAILEEILYRYENRGDEASGFSPGVLLLIEPFRQLWL